tara:strand:+ start:364 stop:651 length:288 start_codon:yes stop_codon:yes gene_type:complete
MKVLKAKISHPNKEVFRISELTIVNNSKPLKELVEGEQLINPIEVILHLKSNKIRMGAQGIPYKEKRYSISRGSQRVEAAKKLGYTHIEGIIINE